MNISRPSLRAVFLLSLMGAAASSAGADDLYFTVDPAGIPEALDAETLAGDPTGRFFSAGSVSGGRVWGLDSRTGQVTLAGLYDAAHGMNFEGFSNTKWMTGFAERANETVEGGWLLGGIALSAWVSDLTTGNTSQVGLYDSAHALPNSSPTAAGPAYVSVATWVGASGHVLGVSLNNTVFDEYVEVRSNYFYPYFSNTYGSSIWMADATAGAVTTTRFGLFDAAHTMPAVISGEDTLSNGGYQVSVAELGVNENGYVAGSSMQFGVVSDEGLGDGPLAHAGVSLWVGRASTGLTYQVGLTDAQHTSGLGTRDGHFLYPINAEGLPTGSFVTEAGIVAGNSVSYGAGGGTGLSAWVAGYDSGSGEYITTRVGYHGGDAGGIYQDADGFEESEITHFTESGLAGGYSVMMDAPASVYAQSAWVVDASNLSLVEVGLMGGEYELEGMYRSAEIEALNHNGLVAGGSTIFHEGPTGTNWEEAAWVQKVASSVDSSTWAAERIGLVIEPTSTERGNYVDGMTGTGYVYGVAERTLDTGANVEDAWIAYRNGPGYATAAVGLSGGDFIHPTTQERAGQVDHVFDNGVALGAQQRFYAVAGDPGSIDYHGAPWVAKPLVSGGYQTIRVGLHDAFHTKSDGYQDTRIDDYGWDNDTAPRFFTGTSTHYTAGDAQGITAWVIDTEDGITRQVGLTDARHTSFDGTMNSVAWGVNSAGYAWGESTRYTDDGTMDNGHTAWIYAFSDNSLHSFELSQDLTGFAESDIFGVTADGIAYGSFERFDSDTGASLGRASFGWTLAQGVFILSERVLNDTSGNGWTGYTAIYYVNESGKFIGLADDGSLFVATLAAVPEPSSCALLVGLAGLGAGAVRRRRRAVATLV